MNYKQQYDTNIVFPVKSFIAYIFYVSSTKELNVVMRGGKQYRFTITHQVMNEILDATNRASYIAQNIIHGKDYPATFVQVVPKATVEQITLPRSVKFWLSK